MADVWYVSAVILCCGAPGSVFAFAFALRLVLGRVVLRMVIKLIYDRPLQSLVQQVEYIVYYEYDESKRGTNTMFRSIYQCNEKI